MRKFYLLLAVFLCAIAAHAVTVAAVGLSFVTFVDASGNPCAGCKLYSYAAGTTTPLATYVDAGGVSVNTNPIVLDASGGAHIWLSSNSYKFILKNASGATIWSADQVSGALGMLAANGWAIITGGTQTGSGTSQIDTLPGLFSASVNGVYNITTFGAVGDCTGSGSTVSCTHNLTAIQAAIDAAYVSGGSVEFPTNPHANGQTVYYIEGTLNPKGVSLFGAQGSSGNNVLDTKVAVRGAPSKDVFAPGDPSSVGYVVPRVEFSVRDLGIIVDDSVDASASFPNRKPGRSCYTGAINASSSALTASGCYFFPGDVGQAIRVYGAGAAGANLDTTIASYTSLTQVALAATASTSVTNAQTYVSLMGLPVTATVGNCAWAYDAANTVGYLTNGASHSDFSNLAVVGTSNNAINTSCGFFFQGAAGIYNVRFQHDLVDAAYAYVFVPGTGSAALTTSNSGGIADFNVFEHDWIISNYPFTAYGGGENTLTNVQILQGHFGVHVLSALAAVDQPAYWHFDIPEVEGPAVCNSKDSTFRATGRGHTVDRLALINCTNGDTFQWDASFSTLTSLTFGGNTSTNPFSVTGNYNKISIPYFPTGYPTGDAWNVTGWGNTVTTGGASSEFQSKATRNKYVTGGSSGSSPLFGPPQAARGSIVFNRTHDFINSGAVNSYFNDEDNWIWPQEIAAPGWTIPVVVDASSESGYAFTISSGSSGTASGSNGTTWFWGSQFPAGKVRLYIKAKTSSGSPTNAFTLAYSAPGFTSLCAISATLSTSYQIFSCDADASVAAGMKADIDFSAPSAGTTSVAWVAIRPWRDTLSTSLQIGTGGVAMTANQGTGTKVQHSTGNTTTDDCAKFDANGNTVDSGGGCGIQSSGSNGNGRWVTDGSGTITERGCISVTAGGTTHVTGAVTWPLTFPTAIDSYTLTAGNSPDGGDTGTAGSSVWYTSISTSGATANYRCVVDVGGGGCAAISNTVPLCWIAIGR